VGSYCVLTLILISSGVSGCLLVKIGKSQYIKTVFASFYDTRVTSVEARRLPEPSMKSHYLSVYSNKGELLKVSAIEPSQTTTVAVITLMFTSKIPNGSANCTL
jgi:hypothetical protein